MEGVTVGIMPIFWNLIFVQTIGIIFIIHLSSGEISFMITEKAIDAYEQTCREIISFVESYFLEYVRLFSCQRYKPRSHLIILSNYFLTHQSAKECIENIFITKSMEDINDEVQSLLNNNKIIYRNIKQLEIDRFFSSNYPSYVIMDKTQFLHHKMFEVCLKWLYNTANTNQHFSSIIGKLFIEKKTPKSKSLLYVFIKISQRLFPNDCLLIENILTLVNDIEFKVEYIITLIDLYQYQICQIKQHHGLYTLQSHNLYQLLNEEVTIELIKREKGIFDYIKIFQVYIICIIKIVFLLSC